MPQIRPQITGGFGTTTRAAYGLAPTTQPTILRVTNLNDSGAGSFRAALEASGPRVVVFETSGTCVATSASSGMFGLGIQISNPYITIAGQTAPSPGFTYHGNLWLNTTDILIQHIRIRPGHDFTQTWCIDAIFCTANISNVVLDHLSVSWADKDQINIGDGNPLIANITIWRCLAAEALSTQRYNSSCPPGAWNMGSLVYHNTSNVSWMQNIWMHCRERVPYSVDGAQMYVVNNIVYDFLDAGTIMLATQGISTNDLVTSVVGNHYRAGPNTYDSPANAIATRYVTSGSEMYHTDNILDSNPSQYGVTLGAFTASGDFDPTVGSSPITLPGSYTALAGSSVYGTLPPNVGARPLDRDAVDTRLFSELAARTGYVDPGIGFVSDETQVGGFPTLAVNTHSFTAVSNPNTVTGSGYTNLEIQLEALAAALEPAVAPPSSYWTLRNNFAESSPTADGWTTAAYDMRPSNLLVAVLTSIQGSSPVLTDSLSNAWILLTTYTTSGLGAVLILYAKNAVVGAAQTFTVSGTAIYSSLQVSGWTAASTSPFDVETGAETTGGAASLATGSITPNNPNELIITGFNPESATDTIAVDSGFTLLNTVITVPSVTYGVAAAYFLQGAAAAIDPTWTWNGGSNGEAAIAAFIPAPPTTIDSVGYHPDTNRAQTPHRVGLAISETTPVAKQTSAEMTIGNVPTRPRPFKPPQLTMRAWTPEPSGFPTETTRGYHPDTPRLTRGPRLEQAPAQTTLTPVFSPEMTQGNVPVRSRAIWPLQQGLRIIDPAFPPPPFSIEMVEGNVPARSRAIWPLHVGLQIADVHALISSPEMTQGSMPVRSRAVWPLQIGLRLFDPTLSAAFSEEMVQGSIPTRSRAVWPLHIGCQVTDVHMFPFSPEMTQGSKPDQNRLWLPPRLSYLSWPADYGPSIPTITIVYRKIIVQSVQIQPVVMLRVILRDLP